MIKRQVRFAGGDTRHNLSLSPIATSDPGLCPNTALIGDNLCIYGSSFGSSVLFGNGRLPLAAGCRLSGSLLGQFRDHGFLCRA